MGHHYIPRAYLKGFTESGSDRFLWLYDKDTDRFSRASVDKVAQQRGFYSQEVESELNRIIEAPAHGVLGKLRRGETINDENRSHLAIYIGTMMWRVPHIRQERLKRWPKEIGKVLNQKRKQLKEMGRRVGVDSAAVNRRLQEVDAAQEKFEEEVPQQVIDHFRIPWPSEKIVGYIYNMTWRFGTSSGPSFYITSDNPAFILSGLGKPESELSFPISSDLALYGSWQGQKGSFLFDAPQKLVKEVNRRVASVATRFLFYRECRGWVALLARKPNPYLNRIRW